VAAPGHVDPERAVAPRLFCGTEDDYVMIGRHTVQALGSYAAIIALFDMADFTLPPLRFSGRSQGTMSRMIPFRA